jgi:methyl-accepting chemotaxis protein
VVEITAAMEELARTAARRSPTTPSTQADLAAQAEESGDVGAEAVEEAVHGVEEVKKRISGIASRADTLGTRSKEIYRVLDLITEIAQETHILSLNAAIEAAAPATTGGASRWSPRRCGASPSAPRSRSTRCATCSTSSLARSAPRGGHRGGLEGGGPGARAGAGRGLGDRGAALASGDTARVAREISLATQQQNAASDEVVLTLKEVSQVVQRMADGLKQFSSTPPTS